MQLSRAWERHESPDLGRFYGREFADAIWNHSHGPDGKLIYQYPRVQFKVSQYTALLLGLNEGSELLQRLWSEADESQLGDGHIEVLANQVTTRDEEISSCRDPIDYRFESPWLALNQRNFNAYTGSRNQRFRRDELSRIMVGNCLGLAKCLGMRFSDRIEADCSKLVSIKTVANGKHMIGFVGRFRINLNIPEYLGLGKSASRGFGTVVHA